jgi:putative NIF3 family GTP cyclohydrolase 1 type 2
MTAREVVAAIRSNLGLPWNEQTFRDIFKAGNPEVQVKGIATTVMATFDLIRRAHAAGKNMVVTHEPTFWSDRDDTANLQKNPTFIEKSEFCLKNDVVVWRFHDHWHARKPDMQIGATLRALGLSVPTSSQGPASYVIPETTLGAFAADVKRRMQTRALRVVGDPKTKVRRIRVGVGSGVPRLSQDVDVIIGGETEEVDTPGVDNAEYAVDAASLGMAKGAIILGHVISEELGMRDAAEWISTFIKSVPVQFIPAGEPFWV